MARVIILAAGKSTRLDGECKMIVRAGGIPVHEWHSRAWGDSAEAVVLPEHIDQLVASGWSGPVTGIAGAGGPARTLMNYLKTTGSSGRISIVYGDSLVSEGIYKPGDWVGVAIAPARPWDYWNGFDWVRGTPKVEVCCGIYQFEDGELLLDILSQIEYADDVEIGMVPVLRRYDHKRQMERLRISGWQDAGDWNAIKKVENNANV